jgi:integrase
LTLQGVRRQSHLRWSEFPERTRQNFRNPQEIKSRIARGDLGVVEKSPEEKARSTITVRELGDEFVKRYTRPRLKDPATYRREAKSVLAVRIYPVLGDKAAAQVTRRDVEALRNALSEKYEPSSVVCTLATLSRLFVLARNEGLIDCANPASGVERPALRPSVDFLTRDEVENLLEHTNERAPTLHAMIATAIYAGLRQGELFGLRWRDVHLDAGRLDVMRSYKLAPKSGKPRHIPINRELGVILRRWREMCPKTSEGLVFPVDGAMGSKYETLGLADVLTGAGCHQPEDGHPWHMLRHTFASHFVMSGGNILTLQKLLGHSDIKQTLVYAHLAPDFMAADAACAVTSFLRPLLL